MNRKIAYKIFGSEIIYKSSSEIISKPIAIALSQSEKEILEPKKNITQLENVELEGKLIIFVEKKIDLELEFLGKILNSIQQKIEDIVLLDQKELQQYKKEQLLTNQNIVISFGVGFFNIGLNNLVVPYQIKSGQKCKILLADKLADIQKTELLKRNLWNNLKQLFA